MYCGCVQAEITILLNKTYGFALTDASILYSCYNTKCRTFVIFDNTLENLQSKSFIYCMYVFLNDLYCSPNIVRVIKSRRMRWVGHVARMVEERGMYRVLVRKPEGRRPLGRPRRRWVDNIRVDLQEVGCGYMDWIGLAQDRDRWRMLVSAVMNLRVPLNVGSSLTSCKPVSFSRRTLQHGVSK